jgi:hypothetical protein
MFSWNSVRSKIAIGLPAQYMMVWYVDDGGSSQGAGVPAAFIRSDATSVAGLAHPPALIFGNGSLSFDPGNNVSAASFAVDLNTFQTSQINGTLKVTGNVGFNNIPPVAKPTVSGSRGGNAALTSLIVAMSAYGLITDSTSA